MLSRGELKTGMLAIGIFGGLMSIGVEFLRFSRGIEVNWWFALIVRPLVIGLVLTLGYWMWVSLRDR